MTGWHVEALSWITELESAVSLVERGIRARDWAAVSQAVALQPRLRHGLANTFERKDTPPEGDPKRVAIELRVRQILTVRERQLAKISRVHDEAGERLKAVAAFKLRSRRISVADTRAYALDVSQ